MRRICTWLAVLFLGVIMAPAVAFAEEGGAAPDAPVLTAMLHAFLAGASRNDASAHDRFWSEKLVYTSSAGTRFGKAEIMEGLAESEGAETVIYSAEDIRIQQYDDTAVVAFKLIGRPVAAGDELRYFNTGTFVREQGIWKAVAWQATKVAAVETGS